MFKIESLELHEDSHFTNMFTIKNNKTGLFEFDKKIRVSQIIGDWQVADSVRHVFFDV